MQIFLEFYSQRYSYFSVLIICTKTTVIDGNTGFYADQCLLIREFSYLLRLNQASPLKRLSVFLIIKPTRCTSFSNLFLEWNSTCFGEFLCPSSGVFTVHTTMVYVIQDCWHIPLMCVQWKTPDDGQRNSPKHVEFHSKNKFEKLVHLVGFIIRKLTPCTVTRTSN